MSNNFLLVVTVSTYICLVEERKKKRKKKASQFSIIFISVLCCLFPFAGSCRNKGQCLIYFPLETLALQADEILVLFRGKERIYLSVQCVPKRGRSWAAALEGLLELCATQVSVIPPLGESILIQPGDVGLNVGPEVGFSVAWIPLYLKLGLQNLPSLAGKFFKPPRESVPPLAKASWKIYGC